MSLSDRARRWLANGGTHDDSDTHILSNIKTKGSISISNVSVGRGSISEPAPKTLPAGDSLYRGSKYDLAYRAAGVNVSLDLDSKVTIGDTRYRAQAFPLDPQASMKFLKPGVVTPYGRVTGVEYRPEESMWAVLTDTYPAGVLYRPGSSAILCAITN